MGEVSHESEFGSWSVRTCAAPQDLAHIVDTFWETTGCVSYGFEKIVPSGNAELMINLGPPQKLLSKTAQILDITLDRGWLCGVQTNPLFAAPAVDDGSFYTHFVGASLRPLGVKQLLGIDGIDTVNSVIRLGELVPRQADKIYDSVARSRTTEQRFAAISDSIRGMREQRFTDVDDFVVHAMNETIRSKGSVRVSSLHQELGISRKHLNQLYRTSLGISPKMFARLTRFRWILDSTFSENLSWVKVAADLGYFDQSHLIRDFRQFAGESPESFLKNRAPDGESVNYSGDFVEKMLAGLDIKPR